MLPLRSKQLLRLQGCGGPGRVVSRCLGVGLAFATVSSDGKWAGDTKNDRGRDDGLGDRVAGGWEIVRATAGSEELYKRQLGHAVELLQVCGLEGLDENRVGGFIPGVRMERLDQGFFQRQTDRVKVTRVFGLGVDSNALFPGQVDRFLEGGDPVKPIEDGVRRPQFEAVQRPARFLARQGKNLR